MQNLFSKRSRCILYGLLPVAFICLMSSCTNTKQLTYMQGTFDTARLSQDSLREPVIRKGDILSIIVFSDNPTATAIFNQAQAGSTGGSSSSGGINLSLLV